MLCDQVIARETLSVARKSSSASVVINVLGANNYPPVFTPSVYNTTVDELAVAGTPVIHVTVSAFHVDLRFFFTKLQLFIF